MMNRKIAKAGDAPELVIPVRLTADYGFYDDAGVLQSWVSGQLVTDPATIAMLRQRGAQIAEFYGETSGATLGHVKPTPDVPRPRSQRQALQWQYREAKAKHESVAGAASILDDKYREFDLRIKKCEADLAYADMLTPKNRAIIVEKQAQAYIDAELFFAGWLAKA